jgi:hypothetical protein
MANVCFYKIDHPLQIWNYLSLSEKIANGAYCLDVKANTKDFDSGSQGLPRDLMKFKLWLLTC